MISAADFSEEKVLFSFEKFQSSVTCIVAFVHNRPVFKEIDNLNNYYLEYIRMDENGNENTFHDTQCHDKNETKILNGSEPSSQESYTELPQINVQDSYTQSNRNIAVSKLFNSNVSF